MNSLRREQMREFIEDNHVVTLAQLTDKFQGISLMTVHRDLTFLQSEGFIEKIRGGARYLTSAGREAAFAAREIVAKDAKATIAQKAVKLLPRSGSVFIDAGTTMMAFAKAIPDYKINVMTTGPNIALELVRRQNTSISMCGGNINKSNLTLSGSAAEDMVRGINIDTAFLVPSGYNTQAGFTCGMESEARIKQLVVKKARTVVVLMDSLKTERLLPYTFAALADTHYLITEQSPENLPRDLLEMAGSKTIIL